MLQQPKLLIYNPLGLSQNLMDIIKQELNVRKLIFERPESCLFMYPQYSINYKVAGQKYGKQIKLLEELVQNINKILKEDFDNRKTKMMSS